MADDKTNPKDPIPTSVSAPTPTPTPTPVPPPIPAPPKPEPPKPVPPAVKPAPKPTPVPSTEPIAKSPVSIADRVGDIENWPLSKQGILLVENPRRPHHTLRKGFLHSEDVLAGKIVVYDGDGKEPRDVLDRLNLRQEQLASAEALAAAGWEIA